MQGDGGQLAPPPEHGQHQAREAKLTEKANADVDDVAGALRHRAASRLFHHLATRAWTMAEIAQ